MTNTLKERLLAKGGATGVGYSSAQLVNPDGPEALARIERLEAALAKISNRMIRSHSRAEIQDIALSAPPAAGGGLDPTLFDHAWALVQAIRGGGPLPHLTPDQAADAAAPYLLALLDERNALTATEAKPEGENTVGAAEREVGRAVYERIETLIGATSGPEAVELDYLLEMVHSVEEVGGWDGPVNTALSTPSPDADRVRIAVEALEVARANAERGGKAPGVEEWRAQSMCRNVVALIDKALAALKAAALSPAPEDKEAGR